MSESDLSVVTETENKTHFKHTQIMAVRLKKRAGIVIPRGYRRWTIIPVILNKTGFTVGELMPPATGSPNRITGILVKSPKVIEVTTSSGAVYLVSKYF